MFVVSATLSGLAGAHAPDGLQTCELRRGNVGRSRNAHCPLMRVAASAKKPLAGATRRAGYAALPMHP